MAASRLSQEHYFSRRGPACCLRWRHGKSGLGRNLRVTQSVGRAVPTYFSICGSLRAGSYTALVLDAVVTRLRRRGASVDRWASVADLPAFNPDLDPMEAEGALLPPVVSRLRERASQADGLLVASPEYARGYPGALKNCLDWLVGSRAVFGRPAAVITVSPGYRGGAAAAEGLASVLMTMSASPVHVLSVGQVPLKTTDGRLTDSTTLERIESLIAMLLTGANAG
jgi:chromate reductase, NAD(P)H dehydrogenase (quinone)